MGTTIYVVLNVNIENLIAHQKEKIPMVIYIGMSEVEFNVCSDHAKKAFLTEDSAIITLQQNIVLNQCLIDTYILDKSNGN